MPETKEVLIPISQAQKMMEEVANGVATKIMAAFGIEDKKEEVKVSPEIEKLIEKEPEDVKAHIIKLVQNLSEPEQSVWIKAYFLKLDSIKKDEVSRIVAAEEAAWHFIDKSNEEKKEVSLPENKIEEKKEEVMASEEVKVTADANQNVKGGPKGELVSNIPSGESASSGTKGNFPDVPGKTVTEGPALDALPKGEKTKFALQQKHEGDYASLAKQSDAEIEKLKRQKGMMTEVRKMAFTDEGLVRLEKAIKLAKTEEATEFIQKEIEHLVKEKGYEQDRAVAAAHEIAREKGFDVPKK
jgi:hypothetical protein